jgi:hypothetical protein
LVGLVHSSKRGGLGMHTGTVKKWIDARGYGFIKPDDGSFVPEGAKVEYQLAKESNHPKFVSRP